MVGVPSWKWFSRLARAIATHYKFESFWCCDDKYMLLGSNDHPQVSEPGVLEIPRGQLGVVSDWLPSAIGIGGPCDVGIGQSHSQRVNEGDFAARFTAKDCRHFTGCPCRLNCRVAEKLYRRNGPIPRKPETCGKFLFGLSNGRLRDCLGDCQAREQS